MRAWCPRDRSHGSRTNVTVVITAGQGGTGFIGIQLAKVAISTSTSSDESDLKRVAANAQRGKQKVIACLGSGSRQRGDSCVRGRHRLRHKMRSRIGTLHAPPLPRC